MKTIVCLITACAISLPASAALKVTAAPFCVINDTDVIAHTIVESRWSGTDMLGVPASPGVTRTLWNIRCNRRTGECLALDFSLENVEAGRSIQALDFSYPVGMRLTSVIGKVATITWPQFVTITIDLGKKRFDYRSSSEKLEVLGSGSCDKRS